jgi:hypothetical protein
MKFRTSAELVEQCPGSLQIGRIEALGEPVVDRAEQFVCLGPPALVAPQPGEAHRGAQLPQPCALVAADRQGLLATSLGFLGALAR